MSFNFGSRARQLPEPPTPLLPSETSPPDRSAPKPKWPLFMPVILVVVMGIGILDLVVEQHVGISVVALAAIATAVMGGQRRAERALEETERQESGLRDPELALLLTKVETVLFMILAFVLTPGMARLLLRLVAGPNPGELGFGGIVFLVGGFAGAIVVALSLMTFQRFYMQDDYKPRLLLNGVVIGWMIWLVAK